MTGPEDVLAGHRRADRGWLGRVAADLGSGAARSRARLTAREHQVAELLAQGRTNREIARLLAVSPRTAEAHVQHVLAALGFRCRCQVAAWW